MKHHIKNLTPTISGFTKRKHLTHGQRPTPPPPIPIHTQLIWFLIIITTTSTTSHHNHTTTTEQTEIYVAMGPSREACDRCHSMKTRCVRAPRSQVCLRCSRLGISCNYSPPGRTGRPLGSRKLKNGPNANRKSTPQANGKRCPLFLDIVFNLLEERVLTYVTNSGNIDTHTKPHTGEQYWRR